MAFAAGWKEFLYSSLRWAGPAPRSIRFRRHVRATRIPYPELKSSQVSSPNTRTPVHARDISTSFGHLTQCGQSPAQNIFLRTRSYPPFGCAKFRRNRQRAQECFLRSTWDRSQTLNQKKEK